MAILTQFTQSSNNIVNSKNTVEVWDFRDKQGTSIFGSVKVMNIGMEANGTVVSQPIEEGSFFSYNKTAEPHHVQCVLCFEGNAQHLQSMLTIVEKYKTGLDTFSIVTPYAEYENMSLESYSHARDVTNGYGLLYVQCEFKEIQEVEAAYSSTDVSELPPPISDPANPSDASTVNTGMTTPGAGSEQTQKSAKRSRSMLHEIFY